MAEPTEKDLEGIGNSITHEEFPSPLLSPCEELINKNLLHNASIIIGRDRPAGLETGYGKFSVTQGGDKCTTIDITAGRNSTNKDKLTKSDKVGNNFQLDASRIYISQKTNIDENFLIEEAGTLAQARGKAAIGIKSDNVRIIGRETVKIVAKTGEPNSLGQFPQSTTENVIGIQLITGCSTNPEDVQGIVKSDNLQKFLDDLVNKIDTILGTFHGFVQFQTNFNNYVANHKHDGHFRSDIAGAVRVLEPFDLISAFSKYNSDISSATNRDIDNVRKSLKVLKKNYLSKANAKKYIGSIYNKTN